MEIVSADGSKTQLKPGQTRELGRAHGFNSSDKTISRRQISFFIPPFSHDQEIRAQFEILGKNPVYIYKDNEVKVYRRFERGEMGNGDMFCVSAQSPVWYSLREVENGAESVRRNDLESELAENLESGFGVKVVEDLQQEGVGISDIDPVQEFGLVVMGHEFDSYPKKMILDIKNWDWFLEESRKDSEDDEDEGRKRNGSRRRKRKKGTGDDEEEEEWTGESEDENVAINKSRKDQRPKYMTRAKDRGETSKDRRKGKSTGGKKNRVVEDEDEEDEDEDDETLGGFIVDNENVDKEEEFDEEEEEEEELGDEDE